MDDGLPAPPASVALQWTRVSGPGGVLFSSETGAATNAIFESAGTYVLRLTADDGEVRVFDDVAVTAVSVSPSFSTWIAGFAGVGNLNGVKDDPDGDGIANLLEYSLLDGNPSAAGAGIAPAMGITKVNGSEYLMLTVERNPSATGISYAVEVSGDLTTWNSGPADTTTITDTISTLVVRDNSPLGGANTKRYIRLKVTQP